MTLKTYEFLDNFYHILIFFSHDEPNDMGFMIAQVRLQLKWIGSKPKSNSKLSYKTNIKDEVNIELINS